MTSSFLILTQDIPRAAYTVTSSTPFEEDFPLTNARMGRGYSYSRIAAPTGSLEIVFDLGYGRSWSTSYFAIGGVKSLIAASVNTIKLSGATWYAPGTWIDLLGTSSNFLTKTANGPYKDDMIFMPGYNDDIAGPISGNFRYFKVTIAKSSGTAQFAFRNVSFGPMIDMGREPSNYNLEVLTEDDADTWKYPRGHTILSRSFYPKHRITIEWDGISDDKTTEFLNSVLWEQYRDRFYLYTSQYQDPLYDNKLMYCRVIAESCKVVKDNEVSNWNNITAVFEEE